MSDAPIDLNRYRRTVLEKRIALAKRCLELADLTESDNAQSVTELRAFARIEGIDADQAKTAVEFADQMESTTAKTVAGLRAPALEELQIAQAELDRLTGPDER